MNFLAILRLMLKMLQFKLLHKNILFKVLKFYFNKIEHVNFNKFNKFRCLKKSRFFYLGPLMSLKLNFFLNFCRIQKTLFFLFK
jgi:hypothetical protein